MPAAQGQTLAVEAAAMRSVLPEAACGVYVRHRHTPSGGDTLTYYKGYRNADTTGLTGYVVKVQGRGYNGQVETVAGIGLDGRIAGLKVISQKETPGLGDKIVQVKSSKTGNPGPSRLAVTIDAPAGRGRCWWSRSGTRNLWPSLEKAAAAGDTALVAAARAARPCGARHCRALGLCDRVRRCRQARRTVARGGRALVAAAIPGQERRAAGALQAEGRRLNPGNIRRYDIKPRGRRAAQGCRHKAWAGGRRLRGEIQVRSECGLTEGVVDGGAGVLIWPSPLGRPWCIDLSSERVRRRSGRGVGARGRGPGDGGNAGTGPGRPALAAGLAAGVGVADPRDHSAGTPLAGAGRAPGVVLAGGHRQRPGTGPAARCLGRCSVSRRRWPCWRGSGSASIWRRFPGRCGALRSALIAAGLISMAFMGFSGMIGRCDWVSAD